MWIYVYDWPVTNKLLVDLKVEQKSLAVTHTVHYASADLLLLFKSRTKIPELFLPAETPPVSCLSCRNVWTRHFICLLYLSGSLKMAEGSRHTMCPTVGYFRGLFSCTLLTMFDSPCMQSILNWRTLSSELLLLWKGEYAVNSIYNKMICATCILTTIYKMIFLNDHTTLRVDSAPKPMSMCFGWCRFFLSATSSLVSCSVLMSCRTSLLIKRLSRPCQKTISKVNSALCPHLP